MAVREEVRWLGQKRLLTRNRTQFLLADGRVVRFAKPFIEEADLHDDAVGEISQSVSDRDMIRRRGFSIDGYVPAGA